MPPGSIPDGSDGVGFVPAALRALGVQAVDRDGSLTVVTVVALFFSLGAACFAIWAYFREPPVASLGLQERGGTPPVPAAGELVVTSGGRLHDLTIVLDRDEVLLGRAEECDLRLPEPHVSRRHALVRRVGGDLWLEDAGSTGGTFRNGHLVTGRERLQPGDELRLGEVEVAVRKPDVTVDLGRGTAG